MNTKKVIGQVTTEEKNEIQTLFERRNGLNELAKIVSADNTELYEKLVKDMGETGTKFQNWWKRMKNAPWNWQDCSPKQTLFAEMPQTGLFWKVKEFHNTMRLWH